MALTSLTTAMSPLETVVAINNNLTALDSAKANTTDLSAYIPTSQKGAASGVPSLDASGEVNQNAKTATTAKDYNTTTGTIQAKFAAEDSEIANIKNGNTVVGKARELSPLTPPDTNSFYGTPDGSQTPQWLPFPKLPDGGYLGPTLENFTSTDSRWSAQVSGVYTLTFAHGNRYPTIVMKENAGMYTQTMTTIQRDSTNIYILSTEKFGGYVVEV